MLVKYEWDSGDWEAWVKDGVLLQEGHSVPTQHLIRSLGIEYKTIEVNNEDERYGMYADLEEHFHGD